MWELPYENEEDAVYYFSSLLKANRNNDQYEQYFFSDTGNEEVDPNQSTLPSKQSNAPTVYGSKTFTPPQLQMSIYAKEFLAVYYAFKGFGHFF